MLVRSCRPLPVVLEFYTPLQFKRFGQNVRPTVYNYTERYSGACRNTIARSGILIRGLPLAFTLVH